MGLDKTTLKQLKTTNHESIMNKTIILAFTILTLVSPSRTNSPVYLDNGLGQTMNVGDWENVEDLRQEILNLLGIKHVPSKKAPHFLFTPRQQDDEPLHDEHFSLDHRERG